MKLASRKLTWLTNFAFSFQMKLTRLQQKKKIEMYEMQI